MLQPRGVAVVIKASHECIGTLAGIAMHGVGMVTRRLLGEFEREPWRSELLEMLAT